MNFVPAIPQVTQQNQGSGYGDWTQYAGYTKTNPFGGEGGITAVKPPADTSSDSGVAPPESFSDALGTGIDKVRSDFSNKVDKTFGNLTSAFDQAKQGNIYNATQALGGTFKPKTSQDETKSGVYKALGVDE